MAMMKYEEIVPLNRQEQELTDEIIAGADAADTDLTGLEVAVLSRIDAEGEAVREQKAVRRIFSGRKRRNLLLAAAMMIILTTFVYGAAEGWNVDLARALGFSDMMEELKDGYVNIGLTETSDDVTMTVDQAIGDDSSQWILITTDIPYKAAGQNESVVYRANKFDLDVSRLFGGSSGGGESLESFNNDGKVAFWLFPSSYDKLNKSSMELTIGRISREVINNEGKITSDKKVTSAVFHFKWRNSYKIQAREFAENIPLRLKCTGSSEIISCRLKKVVITPVTIHLEAFSSKADIKTSPDLIVEKIRLKDGKWKSFSSNDSSYGYDGQEDGARIYSYATLGERSRAINGNDITGIMIGGTKIELK